MRLSLTTGPTTYPIGVDELKEHLHIDTDVSDHDDFLREAIKVATERLENETGRRLLNQTWVLTLDRFPTREIEIPNPPLSSMTSIEYTDTAGDTQTWSSGEYQVDTSSDELPARVRPAYGYTWPTTRDEMATVVVTYVAGYGTGSTSIPRSIIHALKMYCGTLFENRESLIMMPRGTTFSTPKVVEDLLGPYKVWKF